MDPNGPSDRQYQARVPLFVCDLFYFIMTNRERILEKDLGLRIRNNNEGSNLFKRAAIKIESLNRCRNS